MCRSRALWNVCVLGAGFLLLFSAYNTIQGYATTLLGELGDVSLATLYATVSVAVLFAPWLVRAVGAKRALVGGAGAYVVYMLTLVTGVRGLIIAGSVVIGAGSAGLWVGMGLLSNANAAEDAAFGRYLGYFWAFLQLSNVLGNLATFAVLSDVPAGPWLFVGFAVTGSLGTLVLLALRPVPKRPSAAVVVPPRHEGRDGNVDLDLARVLLAEGPAGEFSPGPGPEAEESPTRGGGGGFQAAGGLAAAGSLAAGSLRAAFGPRLLPLLPLFLLTGLELAFWNASLPLLVRPDRVGLVLAAVGAFDAGGAVLFGWLGDAAGRLAVVVIGCACVVLGAGGSIAVAAAGAPASGVSPCGAQLGQVPVLVWATAAAFGLGDAALNTQTFASIGDMFQQAGRRPAKAALHDDAERHDDAAAIANTVFQLFNNIGSALGFYAGIPLPLVVEAKHGGFELGSVAVAVVTASVAVVAAASMFAARGLNTGPAAAAVAVGSVAWLMMERAPAPEDPSDRVLASSPGKGTLVRISSARVPEAASLAAAAFVESPAYSFAFGHLEVEPRLRALSQMFAANLTILRKRPTSNLFGVVADGPGPLGSRPLVAFFMVVPLGGEIGMLEMLEHGLISLAWRIGVPGVTKLLEMAKFSDDLLDDTAAGSGAGPSTCKVERMVVHPSVQGKGIGTWALGTALGLESDARGVHCVLGTQESRNVTYYERLGFRVVCERDGCGSHHWGLSRAPKAL